MNTKRMIRKLRHYIRQESKEIGNAQSAEMGWSFGLGGGIRTCEQPGTPADAGRHQWIRAAESEERAGWLFRTLWRQASMREVEYNARYRAEYAKSYSAFLALTKRGRRVLRS